MENNPIILQKLDGIFDIQPPVSPPISGLETVILLLLFILFIAAAFYFIWKLFYSAKGKAKNRIRKLHFMYLENNINKHNTIYQLCSILMQGLNLHQINKDTQLPEIIMEYNKEWAIFTENLSILRYKNEIQSQPDINALFKESLHWLKLWP